MSGRLTNLIYVLKNGGCLNDQTMESGERERIEDVKCLKDQLMMMMTRQRLKPASQPASRAMNDEH
jgi:hypothetical protein